MLTTTEIFTENQGQPSLKAAWYQLSAVGIAIGLAICVGYICEQDWPGSIIAVIITLLFLIAIVKQIKLGWSQATVSLAAVNVAALSAVALNPGPLNIAVSWLSLSALMLVQQSASLENIVALLKTILFGPLKAPFFLYDDYLTLTALRTQNSERSQVFSLANILLPLIAVAVFGFLLVAANPIIEQAALQLSWLDTTGLLFSAFLPVSLITFILIFAVLKIKPMAGQGDQTVSTKLWAANYFKVGPLLLTLGILNLMFLIENMLDLRYVWSEASLPVGMNYAEYVHRGSYTLIATAILAGALVVLALRPGSVGEKSKPIRALVYFWTAQNIFLVASSAKRTLAYIDVYGMTLWRLSGLIWMGLVATGLILIVLRVLTKRSGVWLMSANLASGYAVLLFCGLFDLSGFVANWNVERAIDHYASPTAYQRSNLDVDYLKDLGAAALPALNKLARVTENTPYLKLNDEYVAGALYLVRDGIMRDLHTQQSDWRSWTIRGAMLEAK